MSHDPRVPTRTSRSDLTGLRLAPADGFVLSRVDGQLSVSAIAAQTGLTDDAVGASLERLVAVGLVVLAAATARAGAKPDARGAPSRSTPSDEPAVLAPELRTKLMALEAKAESASHYEMLGLGRSADRKAVRKAYYDLVAWLHPDRHFNKDLGDLRARMELVFARVTEAHDVLSSKQKRASYDAALGPDDVDDASTAAAAALAHAIVSAGASGEPTRPHTPAPALPRPHPATLGRAPAKATGARPAPMPMPPPSEDDDRARRDALARRLGKLSVGPAPAPSGRRAPAPPSPADFARAAEQAMANGDFVAASKELTAALELAPHDVTLRERLADANGRAEAAMIEALRERGQRLLDALKFDEAARTWARVAHLAPADALAHARAAQAYRELEGGARTAVEHARKAVALVPTSAEYRVVLARAYIAAAMRPAAKLELEAAVRLAPMDTHVIGLLRSLSKSTHE